jgi:hypothetical protein
MSVRFDALVPPRVRAVFQADALFVLTIGSVLMANPLLGPQLGVNGFVVAFAGVLLLVTAIVLGGAGLGKGPLHGRLRLMAAINASAGVGLAAWALLGNLGAPARVLLVVIATGSIGLAGWQSSAVRDPVGRPPSRRPPTTAELQAALRGESPRGEPPRGESPRGESPRGESSPAPSEGGSFDGLSRRMS